MAILKIDIVTKLKNWFYTKSEVDSKENALITSVNTKANQSDLNTTNSNLSALSSTVDGKADASHAHDDRYYTETEVNSLLDDKVDVVSGKGLSTNDYTTAEKNKLASINTTLGVTVEQQSTAESGYLATYVVKQGGSQVGSKINIPKDYLVKSGSIKTCTTANVPVQGYAVGDKYIDMVINTKDSSGTDEHLYILVSDLVDGTISWENVTGKPSSYPPSTHSHSDLSAKTETIDITKVEFVDDSSDSDYGCLIFETIS